jgi:hypothetical protein
VLAGLKTSPNISALILDYRNIQDITATVNAICTDIIDATHDKILSGSSTRHVRNITKQLRARQPQHYRSSRIIYVRERDFPGVEHACTGCRQDNHTTGKCSNIKNQAHVYTKYMYP